MTEARVIRAELQFYCENGLVRVALRLTMFDWTLKKVFGTKHERELKRMRPRVDQINQLEASMKKLSDEALRAKTAEFREQLDNGKPLDQLLAPAFATCREGAKRALGMRHYDVQLIGGMVLHEGKIAEMKTGEGKTLVATLACYLNALPGKGVHLVTVNDYLATRDAEWMSKLYGFLGLSTGVIASGQRDADKKRAYRSDITYGQNNEYGFDYLRDNMKFSIHDYVQRELNYAIVDEVDSILIDEARTPLIISGPGETASEKYTRINDLVSKLRNEEHYTVDEKARQVTLTEEGMESSQRMLFQQGITNVENLYDPVNLETLHILQQSLRAHTLYMRDQHYMVSPEGKVMIIDEFTGRVLPGRRWSDGLHQAVEAKERVAIQDENITLATISFQNLFRLYTKLSGMTGMADTEATEFHSIYKLDVTVIPTHRPIARADNEDLIYRSEKEKFRAVVEEIKNCRKQGQPVLVGTTSVEKSDALARMLSKAEIPHNVLNAKQHEQEAYVVAQAGRKGSVTVATNMAGRGTDIVLGGNAEMLARTDVMRRLAEERPENLTREDFEKQVEDATATLKTTCDAEKKEVLAAGGLHIIGTERHESRRIDNQLRGRSGRQGDPGASRFYLSLEDDLMRIFAGERLQGMMDRLGMEEDVPIEHKWVTKAVENAQRKVEERNFDIRKHMLEYDDVLNQQRKSIYALRRQVLTGQYRTMPSDEQMEKGAKPEPIVKETDAELRERVTPIVTNMVKFHAATPPAAGASDAEIQVFREQALAADVNSLTQFRHAPLERDLYTWFGCTIDTKAHKNDPKGVIAFLQDEVALSLTEQKERMLDLIDEIIGTMVGHACPPRKHFEEWDMEGLMKAFEEQFSISASGIEELTDTQELAQKLYQDAESVLMKKYHDFNPENFLRLFRNFYLQEIDRQWIEHLQSMDQLRDGIGLRGYGQRDPKKEYKKEGFAIFIQMMESVKASVTSHLFHVERVEEEDLERIEAQRRKQAEERQQRLRTRHPGEGQEAAEGQDASGGRRPSRAARRAAARSGQLNQEQAERLSRDLEAQTVRRSQPKVGRNDPCYCGSGKKYKNCHYKGDRRTSVG